MTFRKLREPIGAKELEDKHRENPFVRQEIERYNSKDTESADGPVDAREGRRMLMLCIRTQAQSFASAWTGA